MNIYWPMSELYVPVLVQKIEGLMQHLRRLSQVFTNASGEHCQEWGKGLVFWSCHFTMCKTNRFPLKNESARQPWWQAHCQLKCQIIHPDQVWNNWNVNPCNTTTSDWNIVQRQGGRFFFFLTKSSASGYFNASWLLLYNSLFKYQKLQVGNIQTWLTI